MELTIEVRLTGDFVVDISVELAELVMGKREGLVALGVMSAAENDILSRAGCIVFGEDGVRENGRGCWL